MTYPGSTVPTVEDQHSYSAWVRTMRSERLPVGMDEYLKSWESFFDRYASHVDYWHSRNAGYHRAISALARFYIPPGVRVLEIGSGNGDLLAALNPAHGVGVDVSGNMVRLYDTKCDVPQVLEKIADHVRARFQKADFLYRGEMLKSCWAAGPDGLIYVVDETGDVTRVPPHAFKQEVGA